jgi:hypothetical protein
MDRSTLATVLARAMMAGAQDAEQIADRAVLALGRQWRWIAPLVRRYKAEFEGGIPPRLTDVAEFLEKDEVLRRRASRLELHHWIAETPAMRPAEAARNWGLPEIRTSGDLAGRLGLDAADLDWFADLRGLACRQLGSKLEHYRYRAVLKRSGRPRLIEAPKSRLKQIQRRLLADILALVPPHPAVHGFVAGRSIASFAAPHAGKRMLLRMDLRDFFPSIRAARIEAFFRTAGYPETVAAALTGLATNAAPRGVWMGLAHEYPAVGADPRLVEYARSLYGRPHLPQGAPTSPALANICFRRADLRLEALARSAGASYTRYADDLAFSGGDEFARGARRFAVHVAAIVSEEGFEVEHRKTRLAPASVRQRLAGVVVIERPSLPRAEIERLEAILTNCVRRGPEGENREGRPRFREHLEGRIAFLRMLHPEKAARLWAIFERIEWS